MAKHLCLSVSVLAYSLLLLGCSTSQAEISGEMAVHFPLTLTFDGPQSSEEADPNPFLDYRLELRFTHEKSGAAYRVPGFYASDGHAAETGGKSGNKWRVNFVPDQLGEWHYQVSFRTGQGIALSREVDFGQPVAGDAMTGVIQIHESSQQCDDSRTRGRLRYVGERYLRFSASGDPFIKSGTDSPENFLSYIDFDVEGSDERETGERRVGEAALAPRHEYQSHLQDWKPGDPTWKGGKGKSIVGALNYLASRGVNSVYFLAMNLEGDGDDVWPYTSKEERFRFDCSKLDQWNIVFDHMDRLGIMLHIVLTETENESLFETEEGGVFPSRRQLYYRELISRFGHHSAITWNIGEENGWSNAEEEPEGEANTHDQRRAFATYIRSLDPYGSPIVVHTWANHDEIYQPLLGDSSYEGPSLQISDIKNVHSETLKWVERSKAAGKKWFVSLDEIGPSSTGVKPDLDDYNHDEVRRYALWGNLMAGGAGCEWYFGYDYPDNDLSLEDFRSRERMWDLTRNAVDFFHSYIPFSELDPNDVLVKDPNSYCLAKEGYIYLIYLGAGGSTEVWLPEATYSVDWFDPRLGGELVTGSVKEIRGGGYRKIGNPPSQLNQDWVALLRLEGTPPVVVSKPPVQDGPIKG